MAEHQQRDSPLDKHVSECCGTSRAFVYKKSMQCARKTHDTRSNTYSTNKTIAINTEARIGH